MLFDDVPLDQLRDQLAHRALEPIVRPSRRFSPVNDAAVPRIRPTAPNTADNLRYELPVVRCTLSAPTTISAASRQLGGASSSNASNSSP
jgi:hypothetical protein